MEYIKNESGEVKCRFEKGVEKWLPEAMALNKNLQRSHDFVPVEAPVKFEAVIEPEVEQSEEVKADEAPAKRGRKPNQ